jgi:hypothetical protein
VDLYTVLLLLLVTASVLCSLAGQWWGLAIPLGAVLIGAALFAAGEPTGPGGGDADPGRLIGGVLLVVGVPWTLLYTGVVLLVRRRRRRSLDR